MSLPEKTLCGPVSPAHSVLVTALSDRPASSNQNRSSVEPRQSKAPELFRVSRAQFFQQANCDFFAHEHAVHIVGNAPVNSEHVASFAYVGGELIEPPQPA